MKEKANSTTRLWTSTVYIPGLFLGRFFLNLATTLWSKHYYFHFAEIETEVFETCPDQKQNKQKNPTLSNVSSWKFSIIQENLDSILSILLCSLFHLCICILIPLSIHWSILIFMHFKVSWNTLICVSWSRVQYLFRFFFFFPFETFYIQWCSYKGTIIEIQKITYVCTLQTSTKYRTWTSSRKFLYVFSE